MMTYKEINEFLASFKSDSYNRKQIGNNKQLIISVYEYLNKLGLSKETTEIIISNIAYLNKDSINISLYLELLSKTLGFLKTYELKDIINIVREIHDIYNKSSANIPLEEYLHDTQDTRIRKLFLNRNNKYILKNFNTSSSINYVCDLKLAAAISLSKKDYNEFITYIDEYEKFQDSYSPLINFKTYNKIREHLKDNTLLFWDTLFGNEYVVALTKNNIELKEIYKANIYSQYSCKEAEREQSIQLDLFSYQETEEKIDLISEDIKAFQLCTIYNSTNLPEFNEEKDLLFYYKGLLNKKDAITLPKLKTQKSNAFLYDMN